MRAFNFLAASLLVFCLSLPSVAQNGSTAPKKPSVTKPVKQKDKPAAISSERKTKILAFVDEHHPELTELLTKIENGKNKRQWHKAMIVLNKSVKKLESLKERSPNRYESALQQWKLESRIKVAAAQLSFDDTEEGRDKLTSMIGKLVDFHIERMKNERKQMAKRIEQLDKKIEEASSGRQQAIEKRLKSALPKPKKEKKKKQG